MQKLYSEIIGVPVFDEYSSSPLALVQDIIIDPENGKVLAFLVSKKRIVVPLDIQRFNSNLLVADKDVLLPVNDVLRVAEVVKRSTRIIGARVLTERSKTFLGRVVDYEIDTTHMVLTKIHTARVFFFFRFQERIISYRNIVKIGEHAIIVQESNAASAKDEVAIKSSAFAS